MNNTDLCGRAGCMRERGHTHHPRAITIHRNGHVWAVWWKNSRFTDSVFTLILQQLLEIQWSLDGGVKETEDMSLLTPSTNFLSFYPIYKAISLGHILLHHLQKLRKMRSHLWRSGSFPNPRGFQQPQSRAKRSLDFGLWHSKFFWSEATAGGPSQDLFAEL